MNTELYDKISGLQAKYVMPTYAPNMLFVKGEGSYLWDDEGNKFLDFVTGISVCNLGHCHPNVTKAIQEQSEKLVHVSNLYMNEQQPQLAEKLVKQGFDGVAFFANSGAEANEGMIKFARKWGSDKGKNEIVAMNASFHGRTLAALAATGRSQYRVGFSPDMPGFKFADYNDIESLKALINDKTAAVMMEPVQGEGGVMPADAEYLKQVRELCDEAGCLLLFDEVQCGIGRTGTFFAYQNYGVEPDAVSLAKAIANGYPMGAFIVKREYEKTLTVGMHASTFGGTPLASAAACAVIDTIVEENLLDNTKKMGAYLTEKLSAFVEKYDCVQEVRGLGLMIGVVLDQPAGVLVGPLKEAGMLALTAGETVLRLLPPLNVTQDQIDTAVELIDNALAEI